MRLKNKTAVITGAATGIGRATALRFADEGARLILADLDEEHGEEVALRIRGDGGAARFLRVDVSRPEDNQQMIDTCLDEYGTVDILFCNAGVFLYGQITESRVEAIDRVLSVNVKALMYAAQAAIPVMLRQGRGNILFNASKTGLAAQKNSPVYCASKGAAIQLARALALDYARDGIRINALCPGIIDTPMLRESAQFEPDPAAAWAQMSVAQPIGRLGTPEECADAALWLVSDESALVTGVALPVDGGFTAM